MRIVVKGGVWKNTEDEILKAAVMKYGKNQWARISSLLTRKTPKQCKARWYEWLDPSIKKTEWAKEEDEKLLHLAKLMPTQWRTIAPIVGRTPSQCLERYQKLLDDAEQEMAATSESGGGAADRAPTADDVRKLRPGEIDPDPEAKPARPDPVDMDEDEKEMLSEARARLANTQGKKAKRKARERQLDESRRLAALQKRRELKAAGIYVGASHRKRGEMDYSVDIPFERKPLSGFFDTTQELNKRSGNAFENKLVSKLDGKRKAEFEEQERKKDIKKRKAREESGNTFVPGSDSQKQAFEEPERSAKRSQLTLPAPQVSDAELDEIVKLSFAGEATKSMVEQSGHDGTTTLLSNYSAMSANLPMRTPRTPAAVDTVRQEARNLLAMKNMQTPLLGEESTPLHSSGGTGFDGITPRRAVAQTPNAMLLQMTPRGGASSAGSMTPRSVAGSSTPMRTPFRDEMGINTPSRQFEETPRNERQRIQAQRSSLAQALATLPKPKNDFQIIVPDANSQAENEAAMAADKSKSGTAAQTPDLSDMHKEHLRQARALEDEQRAKQSQAVQRQLPRPTLLPPTSKTTMPSGIYAHNAELQSAEALVLQEMVELLKTDMHEHPQPGAPPAAPPASVLEDYSLAQMARARALVDHELERVVDQMGGLPDLLKMYGDDDGDSDHDSHYKAKSAEVLRDFVQREEGWLLDPKQGKYIQINDADNEQLVTAYRNAFEANRARMYKESQRAAKFEKKLNVVLGGYQSRASTLRSQLASGYAELGASAEELDVFSLLQQNEQQSIPLRIGELTQQVEEAKRTNSELQSRYADLVAARSK
ncbi:Pre-mRNA-splicing factor cef1 [Sorochytrium milnesiophthora]